MAASCQKDTVNPDIPGSKSLDIKIEATNTSFSVLKTTSVATPAIVWDSSLLVVSKIEFEAEKKDSLSHSSTEIHYEWDGPKKLDILGLNTFVGRISLPADTYHEISLKLTGYKSDAGNSPVFRLSGTYTNAAGAITPITLEVNEDIEFRVKQEGFGLDASVDYTSLVHMNLSLLLADVTVADLDAAALTDGKIVISATSNTDIYDIILGNLSTCCEYHFSEGRLEAGDDHGSNSGNDGGSGNNHGSDSGNNGGSNSGSGSGY